MNIQSSFEIENEIFYYYDLQKVFSIYESLRELPISLKILLEENLRKAKSDEEIEYIIDIFLNRKNSQINLYPSRIIMQGFSGLSSIIDLVSMQDKVEDVNINQINPQVMVDLILDNTLNKQNIDDNNVIEEYKEKYEFLKWAQNWLKNFRIIPPGSGVCHQINLEYLSTIVHLEQIDGKNFLFPETLVGTNSEDTKINSLGVIGLKVGGMDVHSVILGLPLAFNLPKVLGIKLTGVLNQGVLSSDLLNTLINKLKEYAVFGKIVEFYGDGVSELALEDKTTLSNIAFSLGIFSTYFPIDDKTLMYYDNTRDNDDFSKLIKIYLEKQSLYFENKKLRYDETIEIDLKSILPIISNFRKLQEEISIKSLVEFPVQSKGVFLSDADIVLCVINASLLTSNPYLFIHAGLVAKKAYELGLNINENIKKSLILNDIVKEYLEKVDLLKYFKSIAFNISTSSNDLQLNKNIEEEIKKSSLNVVSLNFENKILEEKTHFLIKSNYSMSPSLIVAYTFVKSVKYDIFNGYINNQDNKEIKLIDIWPSYELVIEYLNRLDSSLYKDIYKNIYRGNSFWQEIKIQNSNRYIWNENSTYIQASKFFETIDNKDNRIINAGVLAIFGNAIMANDISPFGKISLYSPAANYLEEKGVKSFNYNTFKSREGDSNLMLRGSFDSSKLKNKMVSKEGGYTKDFEKDEIVSIYELSKRFKEKNRPLVIFAGREYGSGDSSDWPAKVTNLLGVKAVIANSYDRVHKSNLIKMGILPLEFIDDNIESLNLKGNESISIKSSIIKVNEKIEVEIRNADEVKIILVQSKIETNTELIYYNNGGILTHLLRNII